jgi:hypothetical protein
MIMCIYIYIYIYTINIDHRCIDLYVHIPLGSLPTEPIPPVSYISIFGVSDLSHGPFAQC